MKTTLTKEEMEVEKTKYTRKIEIPIYEPKNEMPHVSNLYNKDKCNELQAKIKSADIPNDIKEFLYSAAERHTSFNFSKIADFYAHSDFEIKRLFEESALVIIDYDNAVRNGFISYQKEVDDDVQEYINGLTEEDLINNLNDAENKLRSNIKPVHIFKKIF